MIYKLSRRRCLWFVVWGRGLNQPRHITNAALPSEGGGIVKRIKTTRLRRKTNPVGTRFTSAHNCDTILSINYLTRTRSIASLPCKIVFGRFDATSFQEIIISPGVFRRETARGFYPWGNVECPRERVAEGLCGWRHGNSFPMTQSAQSLRQMRSIPCLAPRLFFMFLFLIPFTIRQQCIIYAQIFSTEPE